MLLQEVELHCASAADPASWWDGEQYDAIVIDAPCSATAIMQTRPEVKVSGRGLQPSYLSRVDACPFLSCRCT